MRSLKEGRQTVVGRISEGAIHLILVVTVCVIVAVLFHYALKEVAKMDKQGSEPATKTAPAQKVKKKIPVMVTAYSPTVRECDSTPYITAFNKRVKSGTIAVSRDLERVHGWKKGNMVHLEGIGTFEVWDRMNKRFKKRVDIFYHDTRMARQFGKTTAMAVKL